MKAVLREERKNGAGITIGLFALAALVLGASGCGKDSPPPPLAPVERSGGGQQATANGQNVFREETFGNEGFWTDAARLPQGILKSKLTPAQALKAGLSVNVEALDPKTQKAISDEIAAKGMDGPLLNDPRTTIKLINANAVIGMVVKDSNGDGKLDVQHGDKVGVSCVLCHAITDKSVLSTKNGGSIGREVDGPANHNIAVGAIFAMAANTRAFFPMAQLKGADGKSIGRAPSDEGLTKDSTEAEFDAYFSNPKYYPRGMFDDTVDGNGNPMHNTPMFRADLSAPFGSAGELATVDQFSNTVYTVLLDPTDLLTPGGKAFLHLAAGAAGDKLARDYASVLADTGVKNYPYLRFSSTGTPGTGDTLIGIRVDNQKLLDEKQYMESLRAPTGLVTNPSAVERGRLVFQGKSASCTACHGLGQSTPVPANIIDMKDIFPGDNPFVIADRTPPLSPVLNTADSTFDDKMIVINASLRGLNRGVALPLLMDLARKPVFLHDNSVASLDDLFNEKRGASAPHPFYLAKRDRADLVEYLRSLDDTSDGGPDRHAVTKPTPAKPESKEDSGGE